MDVLYAVARERRHHILRHGVEWGNKMVCSVPVYPAQNGISFRPLILKFSRRVLCEFATDFLNLWIDVVGSRVRAMIKAVHANETAANVKIEKSHVIVQLAF